MLSDIFKNQLLAEAKQIDSFCENSGQLEKNIQEIIDGNDKAILDFIKLLSEISHKESIQTIKQKREEIIQILYQYLGAAKVDTVFETAKNSSSISLEELMDQLNALVGLKNVKQQISDLISFNKVQQLRVKNGLKRSQKTLHMALIGNPGTAKTTVARIIGKMYKSIGLLSKGHFIEAGRTDLIAEYQGQTAIKVKRLINKARGGVLFIDEAYSITENENGDSYGRECLTELTKALEDYREDLVVIVAGYKEPMNKFFDSNPGLKSRFNTFITFDDYNADELEAILISMCRSNDYILSDELKAITKEYFEKQIEAKDDNFANGRLSRNVYDSLIMNQSRRIVLQNRSSKEDLSLLKAEDFNLQ